MSNAQCLLRLQKAMIESNLDYVLIPYSSDLEYLIGYWRERRNGTDTNMPGDWLFMGVVGCEGGVRLILPSMAGQFQLPERRSRLESVDDMLVLGEYDNFDDQTRRICDCFSFAGKRVGVTERLWARSMVALSEFSRGEVHFMDASRIMQRLRMVKDETEIAKMREANLITGRVMADVVKSLKRGVTERDVLSEIEYLSFKYGAAGMSFATGVTFSAYGDGEREGHQSEVTNRALRSGMTISFDFGLILDGYCSDFGRSVFFGDVDPELVKIHPIVMEAQSRAMELLRPGTMVSAVDGAARRVIEDAGYGDAFIHRTGHGIGMDVHEYPYLTRSCFELVQENMTFTIEPSVLLSYGCVRVEDVIRATPNGGEYLTDFHHDLIVLD